MSCMVAVSACPKCKDPVMLGGGNMIEKVFLLSQVRLFKWSDPVALGISTNLGSYFIGST